MGKKIAVFVAELSLHGKVRGGFQSLCAIIKGSGKFMC